MTVPSTTDAPLSFAFATYASHPELQPDDELLATALRRFGAHVAPVAWSDADADWGAHDAVVLRSTWDYFVRLGEFHAWLDALEAADVSVLNPLPAVRWNLDKRYLRELAGRGVPVVPTRWLEPARPGERVDLRALLDDAGWRDAVIKPAVSGGAHETWRTSQESAAQDADRLTAMLARGPVLVQPFVPEIVSDGEWSLLFFGGAFSHAARKRPQSGDFRVQVQFGGHSTGETPPAGALEGAQRVLAAAAALTGVPVEELAYARVDGCVVDGAFTLMELEIVEPALFLAQEPRAADRAAAALLARAHAARRCARGEAAA